MTMNKAELLEFSRNWLDTWTGNRPEELIQFYSEHALYVDPANREGLRGHAEILPYFRKLLSVYEEWVWKPIEVFPIETGFILKWECTIPISQEVIREEGIDIVEMADGKITRNEVYFDRTRLMQAVAKRKSSEQRLANL
jgi:hypothetical protein